ncbi:MAG: autotransporter-associated beta strand repeat-containing protein [Kiritimatiellae bacterium]|jgi:fibronectin-binding autotransporter adhesin|nr:autotransporter-associated beta strand repeat-containing protein [Kiritimatiellia bacterium]
MKNIYTSFLLSVIIAGAAVQMKADTYVWRGTVDSNFANSSNWDTTPGPSPYNVTNLESRLTVANGSGSPIYYTTAEGHTIYQNSNNRPLFIGSGSDGAMYITGGIFEGQASAAGGLSYNADGKLVIDGGTYIQTTGTTVFTVKYGDTGTGMLTVSNGLFDVGVLMYGGHSTYNTSGKGVVNLDGGTTRVSKIYMKSSTPNGDSVINFNGGILEANNSESLFLEGLKEANVLAGGVLIDTAGYSIGINQDLLNGGGDGGVTKRGNGILTLGGTNTFTGNIIVEGGTLRAANNSALGTTDGSTTVSNGASFELSGNITITNRSITIAGRTSSNYGALASASGDCTWAGDVLIDQNNTRITAGDNTTLRISGVIDDGPSNHNVEFRGYGTGIMVLSGENTYGGNTYVVLATLRLDGGNNRLPTGTKLFIGNGANLEYATFDLNGYDQEVALLDDVGIMDNSVIDSAGGGTLTINDGENRTFAGDFVGPLTLAKTNSNVLTLTADMQATSLAVNQGTLQGSATWHCLFNDSDTPNGMTVTGGTLDISAMTFDFDESTPVKSGTYVIVDYSAGGSLLANAAAPFFAATVDMPDRSSLRHDTVAKQILFSYWLEGTLILVN